MGFVAMHNERGLKKAHKNNGKKHGDSVSRWQWGLLSQALNDFAPV